GVDAPRRPRVRRGGRVLVPRGARAGAPIAGARGRLARGVLGPDAAPRGRALRVLRVAAAADVLREDRDPVDVSAAMEPAGVGAGPRVVVAALAGVVHPGLRRGVARAAAMDLGSAGAGRGAARVPTGASLPSVG